MANAYGGEREIDSLKQALADPQNVHKVQTLNELTWEYLYNDLGKARLYGQQAYELANADTDLQDFGDSRMRLGSICILENNPHAAIPLFKEAIDIRFQLLAETPSEEALVATIRLAGAYDNLAISQDMTGDYEGSAQSNAQAVKLLYKYKDDPSITLTIAKFLNNRANALQKQKELELALVVCDSAQRILKGLDKVGYVQLSRNLLIEAQINIDINQCDIAQVKLNEAADLLSQIDSEEYFLLQLALKEGIVARCQGRVEEAISRLSGLYPQAEELGQMDILLTINSQLIEVYMLQNESDSVRKYLSRQKDLHQESNDPLLAARNYLNLIELELRDENTEEVQKLFLELNDIWGNHLPINYRNRYATFKAKYFQLIGNYMDAYKYSKLSQSLIDTLFDHNQKAQQYGQMKVQHNHIQAEKETQSRIDLLIMISLSIVIALLSLTILFMRRSFKERSRALSALNQQTRLEQKVDTLIKENEISSLNSLLQGQEKERERIGRELHDGVGATLSTVKLYINGINDQMNLVTQEKNMKINAANQLIDNALQEVRSISYNLSKGMLAKLGLKEALYNFGQIIQSVEQADIKITARNISRIENGEVELMIYRNIQELVGNAIKHGKANKIQIAVTQFDDIINIIVEDNGNGFDYTGIKKEKKGGIGLFNMEHTIKAMGGSFEVNSSPGMWTTVSIDVPIKD
ncbi:MAG: sensor histidine kinase [Bacteroidota bacterium]